jgi:hypothetical protein
VNVSVVRLILQSTSVSILALLPRCESFDRRVQLCKTGCAIGYRLNHGTEGSKGITLNPDGVPVSKVIAMQTTKDDKGNDGTNPVKDKDGNYVFEKP